MTTLTAHTTAPTERRNNGHARIAQRRVMCVTDQPLLADGLRTRLGGEPVFEWCGVASSLECVLEEAQDTHPDVVIIDLATSGGDTFETIRALTVAMPQVKIVALAYPVRDHDVRQALRAGVHGFFSKRDHPRTMLTGLRSIGRGRTALGAGIRARCVDAEHDGEHATTRLDLLTRRELEVLRLFGRGLTRLEIAQALHRSPKTIDCHRASLMKKLEVSDRVELARYAIREGLAEA